MQESQNVLDVISKGTFYKYRKLQATGAFNMVEDADQVAQILHLKREDYFLILGNYDKLCKAYLKK